MGAVPSVFYVFLLIFFLSWNAAGSVIEQDLFGDFKLETGTLPFCWQEVSTYHEENEVTKFSSASFGEGEMYSDERSSVCEKPFDYSTDYDYERKNYVDVVRQPATAEQFGSLPSSIDYIAITQQPVECRVIKYEYSKPLYGYGITALPSAEPNSDSFPLLEPVPSDSFEIPYSHDTGGSTVLEYEYSNVKFSVATPREDVFHNGIRLTPKKRYLFVENNSGQCVYSASPLKRIPIQDTYHLVRSPLLKPPPSYCKSKLQITGTPGMLKASEMLFDGRPSSCLKGKLSLIQEHNAIIPGFNKSIQDSVAYYSLPHIPFSCNDSTIYLGATQLLKDISIGNVVSLKAGKYFGMYDEPMPYYNFTHLLSKVSVCLYATAFN